MLKQDSLDESIRAYSEGLSSLSSPLREGKGLMVQIAGKLQL